MIEEILTSLGLSPEQVQIYQSLLKNGPQSASQLSRTTKVQRTYIYRVAQELVAKGLVSLGKKEQTSIFSPLSPDHLLTQAEAAKQSAIQAQTALEGILPSLKNQFAAIEDKPVITYFEGVEGVKKVFADIYAPKNEPVYGCVDLVKSNEAIPGYIVNKLIPLRVRNKVYAKTILSKSKLAQSVAKKDKTSLRQSRIINGTRFPLPAEIDVYEDKVAMLSFAKGKFVGVLVQNKDIAQSLKSIFKLAHERSRKTR